ncbi:flavodoxin reductase [Mameliella sp. CS4]|uniref:FAD-binding oxidoreductase n=1 Tax=Mameliella sp. CS4 TaxID=2862329 RepID=UPI001C6064B9|nr:FAD-binding oxidoreductase [Mameliella sp. CS4]MBW4982931.1 flavodoxin reductase [Mameliella sp. CS4]
MTHQIELQSVDRLTHDVRRLTFEKPAGYDYAPGQATDFALDRDGWREEQRPFTFTSLPDEERLEFVIKSYPEHDGVTEQIADLQPGEKVLIGDPWGAIEDKGDGVFIAGGAGVTPFISILRKKLADKGTLEGNTLIFSNQCEGDIVMRNTFEAMPGLRCHWTVTEEKGSPLARGLIDAEMLKGFVDPDKDICYVCGPDPMVEAMPGELQKLGVPEKQIVTEDFG